MTVLSFNDILKARERLQGVAHRTPVLTSRQFNEHAACEVFFKAENLQRAGAFKFRGAYNKLASLTDDERKRGVLAYSSGNHAQATALAAKIFGARAVIVMPQDAPQIKVAATRAYGAEVIFYDRYKESREEVGERICSERGMTLVPPFDDYAIMAGQGTAALELLEDVPELDFLLVPTSGSGLLAVYVAGLVMANRPTRAYPSIVGFHDAMTWLCQIVMFLVLGLLVTPSTLWDYAPQGIFVALVLTFVARPVAVWLCLWPFGFSPKEKLFVSWVGLRGAVSIFLAAIPTLADVPDAHPEDQTPEIVALAALDLREQFRCRLVAEPPLQLAALADGDAGKVGERFSIEPVEIGEVVHEAGRDQLVDE